MACDVAAHRTTNGDGCWGERKTPGLRGVEDPGLGVQQRGAGGKSKLLCSVHLVQAELANFLQLFVGEENLFLISGALDVAEPGFAGDAKDLRFGEAEKDGCPARRHIFWNLAIHDLCPLTTGVWWPWNLFPRP